MHKITFKTSAKKDINKLPFETAKRILKSVIKLENEPRPKGCKKLTSKNYFRIRIGNYRVIYIIDDKTKSIKIMAVRHRKDIYKKI